MIIPRKCPIIPRKLKREDTGSYDNTAEVSNKTKNNSHIMDHKGTIRTRNDVTCFHLMDHRIAVLQPAPIQWITNNHKLEEAFSPFTCNLYGVF